jgi:hypothetical protein
MDGCLLTMLPLGSVSTDLAQTKRPYGALRLRQNVLCALVMMGLPLFTIFDDRLLASVFKDVISETDDSARRCRIIDKKPSLRIVRTLCCLLKVAAHTSPLAMSFLSFKRFRCRVGGTQRNPEIRNEQKGCEIRRPAVATDPLPQLQP